MAETVHPGSWVGDTVEEFKKLPTWGKIVAGLVVLGVVVFAIHVYSTRNSAATTSTVAPTSATNTGGVLPASSYPQSSSAPIPYQPNYIAPADSATPSTATPTATTTTPSLWTVLTRSLWPGQTDNGGGGVPIWQAPNANWNATAGSIPLNQQIQVGQSITGNYFGKQATYYPVTYTSGGQTETGYIGSWDLGNTPPVQSAPPPNSTPVTPPPATGSSGDSRGFHIVQYGENMSQVARAYGLKSWRDFGVNQFWHGQRVAIPA